MTKSGKNLVAEQRGNKRGKKVLNELHVVGIGASAGGLEALNTFFDSTTKDHLAFIVVQHISPGYKSLMKELVSKHTNLRVVEVAEAMPIEPNHVYVVTSKTNVTVADGKLHVGESHTKQSHINLPIDLLFTSMANYYKSKSIGIILSGTGLDGSKGIEAIKKAGGLVIVQDPATAKFNGMPNSAIGTGFADFVLPTEIMIEEISNYVQYPEASKFYSEKINAKEETILSEILMLILKQTGKDFSKYKRPTIIRRLKRRMMFKNFRDFATYENYLKQNEAEVMVLSKEFLINVTHFFRDPAAYEELNETVIPGIFEKRKPEEPVKIWIVGCATGEEAYSIAILVKEYLTKNNLDKEVKIFASDISKDAIATAGKGVYDENIESDVSPVRLNDFFQKTGKKYRINPEIRKMVVFAIHDALSDPPFSKIDLLSCRNLLIYLSADLQKRLLSTFHFALNPGGYLFLGNSENKGEMKNAFGEVSIKSRIFKNLDSGKANWLPPVNYGEKPFYNFANFQVKEYSKADLNAVLSDSLLEEYGSAGVFIDENFEIHQAIGDFKKFLHLPDKLLSFNLLKMVSDSLSIALGNAVAKVIKTNKNLMVKGIDMATNKKPKTVSIFLKPFINSPKLNMDLILILFTNEESKPIETANQETFNKDTHFNHRLRGLEDELKDTKASLQSAVEEMETSNEELQSANEELQSTNEELQSTNEELQSLNEELNTVNSQLSGKIQELVDMNDDLNNYFRAADIGQIFVDRDLNLRNYTPAATLQINIKETDIGRPIYDFSNKLKNIDLIEDLRQVVKHPADIIKEVQSEDDKWYQMKIIPYVRKDNRLDGAVITFMDITERKLLNDVVSGVIESSWGGIIGMNVGRKGGEMTGLQLVLANPRAEAMLGISASKLRNKPLPSESPLLDEKLFEAYIDVIKTGKTVEIEHTLKSGKGKKWFEIGIAKMGDGVVLNIDDVTERKKLEKEKDRYLKEIITKNNQLQHWAYIAANDLQEPLRSIKSFAGLLKKKRIEQIDAEIKEFMGYMVDGAQQMEEMILDLLDYSEIDDSQKPVQQLTADRIIQQATHKLKEKITESHSTIIEDTQMPEVNGIISYLTLLFQHLISNAIKFSKKDVNPVVNIGIEDKGDYWRFYVKDNGIGLDMQFKDRVFQIFQRLNEKSKFLGTGIGLAICKKIVAKHGGDIWVDSIPDLGTVFYFTLPKNAELVS